jgi:hypothetical protein
MATDFPNAVDSFIVWDNNTRNKDNRPETDNKVADALIAIETMLLSGETLMVGPEGDVPFMQLPVSGLEIVVADEGAPDYENGWEDISPGIVYTNYEGTNRVNIEGAGQRSSVAVRAQNPEANNSTIFVLPAVYRPFVTFEEGNLVIETDGRVHLKEPDTEFSERVEFDSEFVLEDDAAKLIPGIDVTITKNAFGEVILSGFAKVVGDPEVAVGVVELPKGFRPAQAVVGGDLSSGSKEFLGEISVDGVVWAPYGAFNTRSFSEEEETQRYLFDVLPHFQAVV